MLEKIKEILKDSDNQPFLIAYNREGEIKLELADTIDGKAQDELAGKLFDLLKSYYK